MKIVLIDLAEAEQAQFGDRPLLRVTEKDDGINDEGTQLACSGGRGKKLRAAFAYAFGEMGADAVITLPENGECNISDIEKLEAALEEGATVAVCDLHESGPLILGALFSLLTRFTAGLTVSPWSSLRAYKADCAELLATVGGEDADYEVALLQAVVTEKLPLKQLTADRSDKNKAEKCKKSFITTVRAGFGILNHSQSLKFLLSSVIAFVIDAILLMIIAPLLPWTQAISVGVAQTIAWVVSSLSNFTINQRFVFRAKGGTIKALGQYYPLAIFVMFGKQGLLYFFNTLLSLPLLPSKIVCEAAFFVLNYFVQKTIIFRRKQA